MFNSISATSTLFVGAAIWVGALIIRLLWRQQVRRKSLPPGPPGLPLLGNVLQLPSKEPWVRFTEWSKEFGELCKVYFFVVHQPMCSFSKGLCILSTSLDFPSSSSITLRAPLTCWVRTGLCCRDLCNHAFR